VAEKQKGGFCPWVSAAKQQRLMMSKEQVEIYGQKHKHLLKHLGAYPAEYAPAYNSDLIILKSTML